MNFFMLFFGRIWWVIYSDFCANRQYLLGMCVILFRYRGTRRRARSQKSEVSGSQGANFTAGGREAFANRSREAGDSVLVKTERSVVSLPSRSLGGGWWSEIRPKELLAKGRGEKVEIVAWD
jgi:hypothetical protein